LQVYVVEAHLDDAALSIGGLLLNLCTNDRINAITVFNIFDGCWAKPTFRKNLAIKDARKLENERALNIVHAKNICLGFSEALDRGYKNCHRSNIPVRDRDLLRNVSLSLKRMLTADKHSVVLFPIAIGRHLGHLIAFESVFQLVRERALMVEQIRLYEDCPHICGNRSNLDRRLDILRQDYFQMIPIMVDITFNAKLKTIMLKSYSSQFGDKTIRRVMTYSSRLGKHVTKEGQLFFERIWAPDLSFNKREVGKYEGDQNTL
jgi:LmbE family N-acetylglucosaminyl deacetylase